MSIAIPVLSNDPNLGVVLARMGSIESLIKGRAMAMDGCRSRPPTPEKARRKRFAGTIVPNLEHRIQRSSVETVWNDPFILVVVVYDDPKCDDPEVPNLN